MQKFQQDIVHQFLEVFIDQTRQPEIAVLNAAKQKQSALAFREEKQAMRLEGANLVLKQYLFDKVCILSHLRFLIAHNPMLLQCLLRHKEGKTFKFIVRNLYYLMTLEATRAEAGLLLSFKDYNLTKARVDQVADFFKTVLYENPSMTPFEKRLKQEAVAAFVREVARNLCDGQNRHPQWPLLDTVFGVGALWMVQVALKEEDAAQVLPQEKSLAPIVQGMVRFRNALRSTVVKQLISECQAFTKNQEQLHLLRQVERVQQDVVRNMEWFENAKEKVYYCQVALSCMIKPFEASKAVQGDKDTDKGSLLNESNLGFVAGAQEHSVIDEAMNEDEDDDEDEEEEESESESDEDEDLLDSDRSVRNFRHSDADEEMGDEYGLEEADDESDDEDLDEEGDEPEDLLDDILIEQADDDERDYGSEESSAPVRSNRGSQSAQRLQSQSEGQASAAQGQAPEADNEEEEDEEYGEGDYYDEEGEEDSDEFEDEDYGDEESDEVEIEVQIRGAGVDRLSNIESAPRQARRWNDVISVNNHSIDLSHMHRAHAAHIQEVTEENESVVSDLSEDREAPRVNLQAQDGLSLLTQILGRGILRDERLG